MNDRKFVNEIEEWSDQEQTENTSNFGQYEIPGHLKLI